MLDYFRAKTRRQSAVVKSPILNHEDEAYFARLAGEETPPALPPRPGAVVDAGPSEPKDAQVALMDGADNIPLPNSPAAQAEDERTVERQTEAAVKEAVAEAEKAAPPKSEEKDQKASKSKKRLPLSFSLSFARRKSQRVKDADKKDHKKEKDSKRESGDDEEEETQEAKEDKKHSHKSKHEKKHGHKGIADKDAKPEQEEQDLTIVLDQLNLSAVNNRAFSFSQESQQLLEKFTQVLKDIIHGGPHAYDDLEKLLSREEEQLNKMYNAMPPFLQNLIKSLPAKMAASIAPELMAASAEKPGANMQASATSAASEGSTSSKVKIPSLKSLLSAEGAVATMLRSIFNFLKLRFPTMMTGTNLLVSLGVFILLFVFWYCHKRGREERLKGTASDDGPAETGEAETTEEGQRATVDDMPSVLHLPDPASVPLPETPDERAATEPPVEQKT